jgi:tryptophanyl-tRNA synthetase
MKERKRILTGIRPTGPLHLGHYVGALENKAGTVTEKVRSMFIDPTRLRAADPGHVAGNPVFLYHDAFNPDKDEVADLKDRYRKGAVGDVEVKESLSAAVNRFLDPIRERRARYEGDMGRVREILAEGTERGRQMAAKTMTRVRDALELGYLDRASDPWGEDPP